jgi:hypothetical protein
MGTGTTPTPERDPFESTAVEQTLLMVGSERPGHSAPENFSADAIGLDEQGRVIISVINIQTREHWHLTVAELPPAIR